MKIFYNPQINEFLLTDNEVVETEKEIRRPDYFALLGLGYFWHYIGKL